LNNLSQYTPKLLTILKTGYTLSDLRRDALAGLTVAVVAFPLAMALAIASGASPEKGPITAVIAGLLTSVFGGSRIQIGGPTGAFVVVVFKVISQYGYEGLLLSTLLAGIILAIAGYLNFGQLIKFIPQPVVVGFTTGIALIIASTQVKDFLGLHVDKVPAHFIAQWQAYVNAFSTLTPEALCLGVAALGTIIFLRKYTPCAPIYLIALTIPSLLVWLFSMPVETIGSRFPTISPTIPLPSLPEWSLSQIRILLPTAFTIAFLAGAEALLSAVVADGMTGFSHRSNQELVGQGLANIGSACFGGLPATGAIARTATNIEAGGKSPMAGIFHSLFVLIFMLLGTDLIKCVPMAALAAVLYAVAWGMSEIHHFAFIFSLSRLDRFVLVLTFFLTVFVDLTVAIGVGVTLSSLLFMNQMSESVEISNTSKTLEADSEDQRLNLPPGVEVFWISGPIFFGMVGELSQILKRIGYTPKVLIIRLRLVPYLDTTGAAVLHDVIQQCYEQKTHVIFSSAQKQPAKILLRYQKRSTKFPAQFAPNYKAALTLAETLL